MKTAICGAWHVHAKDYTETAKKYSEVIGVYDENAERRKAFAAELGIPEISGFDELLSSEAEGVIVCTATNEHTDTIIRLANAKKHIFTEKVLALTDEDCRLISDAVKANGVNFVISLVQKYDAAMITAKSIADSGELGKINYVRFRNCHSGSIQNWLPAHFYNEKECGGGAMIDLGAHGMYIINWILGMPETYKSVFERSCAKPEVLEKNRDGVEDNAVTVMGYKNGAIAINETGFVSLHYPRILEIGGELGTLRVDGSKVTKSTVSTDGKNVEPELMPAEPAPIKQFLTGEILPGCGIKEATDLTHMMTEAYK